MALPDFGLTASDLRVPGMDLSHIPQSSQNDVSLNDLDQFMDEARGDIAVELKRRSLTTSDMTDAGDSLAKRYIRHYAAAEALELYATSGEVHQDTLSKRERAWQMFTAYLDEGADQSSPVLSNTRAASKQLFNYAGDDGENWF